jgi:hypothetical protein
MEQWLVWLIPAAFLGGCMLGYRHGYRNGKEETELKLRAIVEEAVRQEMRLMALHKLGAYDVRSHQP